jgi:hypothetical protein
MERMRVPDAEADLRLPYVPVLTIARSRGYEVRRVAAVKESGGEPRIDLLAPRYFAPLPDFADQHMVSPARQESGGIVVEGSAGIGRYGPPGYAYEVYTVGAGVRITNHTNAPYVGSDEYLFLEMADGSVLTGRQAHTSRSARSLSVVIQPGATGTVGGGPWFFRVGYGTPIRRILYMDGVHHFEWRWALGAPAPEKEEAPQ